MARQNIIGNKYRDIEYVIKLREEAEEKYYGEYRRK